MKVKAGYYIPQLPTKIAVTLMDGTTRITNLTPSRRVTEDELKPLAAIESGAWKTDFFNEFPSYVYSMYGLEKAE